LIYFLFLSKELSLNVVVVGFDLFYFFFWGRGRAFAHVSHGARAGLGR
jgi:hypothetical protein